MKMLSVLEKIPQKNRNWTFPAMRYFHVKTRVYLKCFVNDCWCENCSKLTIQALERS